MEAKKKETDRQCSTFEGSTIVILFILFFSSCLVKAHTGNCMHSNAIQTDHQSENFIKVDVPYYYEKHCAMSSSSCQAMPYAFSQ